MPLTMNLRAFVEKTPDADIFESVRLLSNHNRLMGLNKFRDGHSGQCRRRESPMAALIPNVDLPLGCATKREGSCSYLHG